MHMHKIVLLLSIVRPFLLGMKTRGVENRREKIVSVCIQLEKWEMGKKIIFSPGSPFVKMEFSSQTGKKMRKKVGIRWKIIHPSFSSLQPWFPLSLSFLFFLFFFSVNVIYFISYKLLIIYIYIYNKVMRVNLYKYHFLFFHFSSQLNKKVSISPLFHHSN